MKPTVSIIVPCFNHGRYLAECVASLHAQTFQDWECIIVDDGSTDNTAQLANKLTDEKVKYIYQQNLGLSGARNTGIANSLGEFILPLDADDTLQPDALQKCVDEMTKNTQLIIAYGDSQKFGTETTVSSLLPAFTLKELLLTNRLFCTAMYRRNDIGDNIRYDQNMKGGYEDWEFWIQMMSLHRTRTVKKVNGILFNYRAHEVSMIKEISANDEKKEILFDYIFEKHKSVYREFFPSYLKLLHRKTFYEEKLESIYNSKFYRFYNSILKLFK